MSPDPAAVIDAVRKVALAEIMPRFRRLAAGDMREKGPGDLVTTADVESERRLGEALPPLLPGSRVVGEEAASADPSLLSLLDGPDPVWVVDPVDGTQNFADGVACFAVIVALCAGGQTIAGWIYDPVADETAWAAKGEGAWLGMRRLRLGAGPHLAAAEGFINPRIRARVAACPGAPALKRSRRLGCVGVEYVQLAQGRMDFARYGGLLKPWDHAAGVLIHAEAGGHAALMPSGVAYRPNAALVVDDPLLLARDRTAWERLCAVIAAA